MKRKILIIIMMLNLSLLFIQYPVSAQSFDYLSDVDSITAQKDTFYTLYVNMPYADAKNNFDELNEWTYDPEALGHSHGFRTYIKHKLNIKSDDVIETVTFQQGKDKNRVFAVEVCFFTNKLSAAEQIYQKAVKNTKKFYPNIKTEGNGYNSAKTAIYDDGLKRLEIVMNEIKGKNSFGKYRYYKIYSVMIQYMSTKQF